MLKVEGSMREESHDKEQSSPTNCLPELNFSWKDMSRKDSYIKIIRRPLEKLEGQGFISSLKSSESESSSSS